MAESRPEELTDDRLVPAGDSDRRLLADLLLRQADEITARWLTRAQAEPDIMPPYLEEDPQTGQCRALSLVALVEHIIQGGHDMHLPSHTSWFTRWHKTGAGRANIRDHFHALRDMALEALAESDEVPEEARPTLTLLLEAAVRNLRLETSEFETRRLLAEAVEARQRFQSLFDTSADAIVIVDLLTWEIMEANPAAERLLERSRAELIALRLGEVHADLPTVLPGLLEPRPDGSLETSSISLLRRDAATLVVAANATTLEFSGRHAAQLLLRDITERVRFREELQRRADELQNQVRGQLTELESLGAFLENIINALPIRLLVLDENLMVIHANSAYLSGRRSAEPVKGRHISEVFPAALLDEAGLREAMLSTLATGDRLRWAGYRQPTDDHSERILNIGLDPCPGPEGQRYLLVTVDDVTERNRQLYERAILHQVVQAMLGPQDRSRLLHAIVTGITAGGAVGLGFNRAFLLVADESAGLLSAEMVVGPENAEEAARVWGELSAHRTLQEFLAEYDSLPPPEQRSLHQTQSQLVFPLSDTNVLPMLAAATRQTIHVLDGHADPRVSPRLREVLGAEEFVVAPMVVQDQIIGVVIADNNINRQRIYQTDVHLLTALANHAALAIHSADLYEQANRRADELQEALRKLESTTERLVRSEALAAIGEVTAIVAHEIRNPLSTIGGFAKMLLRRTNEPEIVHRNAGIIADEVSKLESILSGLLDFSKPTRPRLLSCSLRDIVEASLTSVQGRFAEGQVELISDVRDDLPLLPMDCHQMEQVISNLVINALDAMPHGGTVRILGRHEGNRVTLAVSDTGTGIPAHHVEQIFDHFFTTKPTGTGLGLALARKIVEDHGAALEVDSQEGVGSTFSIVFNLEGSGSPAAAPPDPGKGPS